MFACVCLNIANRYPLLLPTLPLYSKEARDMIEGVTREGVHEVDASNVGFSPFSHK